MKCLLNILCVTISLSVACHPYPVHEEQLTTGTDKTVTYIEVVPWESIVGGAGDITYVYVRRLDQSKNPVPDHTVKASIEEPFVATINEAAVTDADGLAVFTVTGVGIKDKTNITFTIDGISYTLDLWNSWYHAFSGGGY